MEELRGKGNEKLFKALMEIENSCYPATRRGVLKQREARLRKELNTKAKGYVTISILPSYSIILDLYQSGSGGKDHTILLCGCGDSFAWDGKPLRCGMRPL